MLICQDVLLSFFIINTFLFNFNSLNLFSQLAVITGIVYGEYHYDTSRREKIIKLVRSKIVTLK